MSRCLRCKAGPEWIEGDPPKDNSALEAAEQRILALEAALRELPFKIAEIPLEPKWSDYPVKQRDNTSKTDAYQLGHGIALLAAANLVRALLHDSQKEAPGD